MCGIFCSLFGSSCDDSIGDNNELEACLFNLKKRGPDHFQSVTCNPNNGLRLTFAASVLQTQGKELCPQPVCHDEVIFCWNGDVFGGPLVKEIQGSGLSDTEVLSKHLSECLDQGCLPVDVFNQISGPYSFIFYSKQKNTLWFGRDPAGRHSLLWGLSKDHCGLIVSSVAHCSLPQIKEVPAMGLFEVKLSSCKEIDELSIYLHPWHEVSLENFKENVFDSGLQVSIKPSISPQYIFRPTIFSHLVPIEDDLQGLLKISKDLSATDQMGALFNVKNLHGNVMKLLNLLETAVKVRVGNNIPLCQDCKMKVNLDSSIKNNSCSHSKVAVLFSGGLDSAILARLTDKCVPQNNPIDLLNVAFEKKQKSNDTSKKVGKNKSGSDHSIVQSPCSQEDQKFNVPDRLTGRATFAELQKLCPSREWNFVEINVPYSELQEERSKCITNLIHPLKTILDDSLGCALWFAARGQGKILGFDESYRSPARVVILGMGADEQFGGYMRHRTILRNEGWEALYAALQMELKRIPSRNLGRDDRVISHHGRQPRMPFLDEDVINFVKSLPPWERCCPNDSFPSGVGDKLLLRLVAWQIGLQGAAVLPKRAMQFGSRIANSKENAADTSVRL